MALLADGFMTSDPGKELSLPGGGSVTPILNKPSASAMMQASKLASYTDFEFALAISHLGDRRASQRNAVTTEAPTFCCEICGSLSGLSLRLLVEVESESVWHTCYCTKRSPFLGLRQVFLHISSVLTRLVLRRCISWHDIPCMGDMQGLAFLKGS